MKEVKVLMEHIEDEVQDARTYAKLALEYRDEDHETAEVFYKLSCEEMDHMNRLHKAVVRIIDEHRRTKGEPPADMMAVYRYLHKRAMDEAEEVEVVQAMYRK